MKMGPEKAQKKDSKIGEKSYYLMLGRVPALKRVLQEIAKEPSGDRTMEARGLLAQIDLDVSMHLVIFSLSLSSHIE